MIAQKNSSCVATSGTKLEGRNWSTSDGFQALHGWHFRKGLGYIQYHRIIRVPSSGCFKDFLCNKNPPNNLGQKNTCNFDEHIFFQRGGTKHHQIVGTGFSFNPIGLHWLDRIQIIKAPPLEQPFPGPQDAWEMLVTTRMTAETFLGSGIPS